MAKIPDHSPPWLHGTVSPSTFNWLIANDPKPGHWPSLPSHIDPAAMDVADQIIDAELTSDCFTYMKVQALNKQLNEKAMTAIRPYVRASLSTNGWSGLAYGTMLDSLTFSFLKGYCDVQV